MTIQILGDLLRTFRHDVIFLSKMKGTSHNIDTLKQNWNLHGVSVDIIGNVGWLTLLWRKENLFSLSCNHIDASVQLLGFLDRFRLTWIYGFLALDQRHGTW